MRHALEVLKRSPAPLTAREIAQRMLAERGVVCKDVSPKAMRSLAAAVQASLKNHNGKTIKPVGESFPSCWQITG
jgi:hypothetical protein